MPIKKMTVMERVKIVFKNSGLSLDELGQRMGYREELARKSAWQFLHKTTDPRLSMLEKFSDALSISLKDIIK
jgi:transcriptional regulator with XRE-family HTH domain